MYFYLSLSLSDYEKHILANCHNNFHSRGILILNTESSVTIAYSYSSSSILGNTASLSVSGRSGSCASDVVFKLGDSFGSTAIRFDFK